MTNDSRLLSAQSMGDTIVVIRPVYPLPWPTWMTKPCKNRGSSEFRPSSDGLHPSSDEVSNLSISLTFPPFHPPKAIHLPSTSRIQAPPLPPLVQVSWRPPVVGRSQGIESLVLSVSVDELRTARWYVAPPWHLAPTPPSKRNGGTTGAGNFDWSISLDMELRFRSSDLKGRNQRTLKLQFRCALINSHPWLVSSTSKLARLFRTNGRKSAHMSKRPHIKRKTHA